MKKLFSLLLALALCAGLLAVPAAAEKPEFEIDENGVLTKYNGKGGDVVIPDGVTAIGEYAFIVFEERPDGGSVLHPSNLTSVIIPEGVTDIGSRAFFCCPYLRRVTFPESLLNIGNWAFFNTPLLSSISLPNRLQSIGVQAFGGTGLSEVTIPASVTSIQSTTFERCPNLSNIIVSGKNPAYCDIDGVLYDKSAVTLITYPGGKNGAYTIPNGVTSIDILAFYECNSLTQITFPNSMANIGRNTFTGCVNLTSVVIPDSVTSIDQSAFWRCESITDVYYCGTEAQWSAITIEEGNDPLLNATIHYSGTDEEDDFVIEDGVLIK